MCTLISCWFHVRSGARDGHCLGRPQQCPLLPKGVQGVSGQGEEIETGHAGARVTNKHPPPGAVDALARLGRRLVKDVLQLLHPQRVGRWQDLSRRISNQWRACSVPLEFAALSSWQGPCAVVPGDRAGEWAERRMDVEMSMVPFGYESAGDHAAC